MNRLFVGLLLAGMFTIYMMSCSDKYVTYENRIVDAVSGSIPMYFYANAMPNYDSANTWYPDFIYYIYQIEEGAYDVYFHAYLITDDSISWTGVTEISIEHGKKIQGYYSAVNTVWLPPEYLERTTPMAYVSVSYEN
jgi:hypothetical protein